MSELDLRRRIANLESRITVLEEREREREREYAADDAALKMLEEVMQELSASMPPDATARPGLVCIPDRADAETTVSE